MPKKSKSPVAFPPEKPIGNALIHFFPERLKKVLTEQVRDEMSRLTALAHHYNIAAEDFDDMTYQLALKLARELYPEPKRPGQKAKWNGPKIGKLVVEMERIIVPNSKPRGITFAATQLAKKEPWKSFVKGANKAETIRIAYTKGRNDPWSDVMRTTFKQDEIRGALAEWDQAVFETVNYSPIE
jgi:hypothetical protein